MKPSPNAAGDGIHGRSVGNAFSINKMGYASAIGVVMFIITMVLTLINMRYITSQEA